MKENYHQAVIDLINAGNTPEEVLRGLKVALASHGHEALLRGILKSVLRTLEAKTQRGTTVTVAKASDVEKHKAAIESALQVIEAENTYNTVTDDTIIGGFVVEGNNRIINNSYKHHLVGLYRKLTN